MPSDRIAPLTDTLVETLQDEADALADLEGHLDRQLDALRAGDTEALSEATAATQEASTTLSTRRRKGERQARLLGRVLEVETEEASLGPLVDALEARPDASGDVRLAEARRTVRERARAVQQRRETLQFALQYAAELNHDLLGALQQAATGADGRTYTADGDTTAGGDRSLVNTLG